MYNDCAYFNYVKIMFLLHSLGYKWILLYFIECFYGHFV